MTATIPTWPLVLTEWGAQYDSNGGAPATYRVDVSARTMGEESAKRGKQYELDTAQAGEFAVRLRNDDAALDPTNTGGPFNGLIEPFQPFQVRAQYPATPNLLTSVQASGGEGYTTGTIPPSFNILTLDPTGGQIVSPGDAIDGTNAFQFANNTSVNTHVFTIENVSVRPLAAYTLQFWARNVSAGTTAHVYAHLVYYLADGTFGAFGSSVTALSGVTVPGGAWSLFEISGTAPANAVGISLGLTNFSAASAANNIQVDAAQFEMNSVASAYVRPGTWYPIFTGFVERWPTAWKEGGSFGYISPTVTDAFALLSQGQLSDPLTEEINAAGATFLYRLDDPSDASQAAEANGRFPTLATVIAKAGPGILTFGNTIGSTTPAGIFTAGGTNPSVVDLNSDTPGLNVESDGSVLSLDGAGIKGPQTPLSWTRMLAFRWDDPTRATRAVIWSAFDQTPGGGGGGAFGGPGSTVGGGCIAVQIASTTSSTGSLGFTLLNAFSTGTTGFSYGGSGAGQPSSWDPCDGNWHLAFFGYNDATKQVLVSVDGVTTGMLGGTGISGLTPAIVRDSLGGYMAADYFAAEMFSGQIAYAAEFPSFLTATQITNIYAAWRNACAGESSAARYARILRYSGYTGAFLAQGGLTTNMGPATDLDGSDALSCLNNVVTTENGNHFVDASGTVRFQGRDFRYTHPTPAFTFGEGVGEYPYEDLQLDFDSTHLASFTEVTQDSTGQVFYGKSATAQKKYFMRTMTRDVNVSNPLEAQDAASYLVGRYSKPLTRITMLKLNPGGQPALWPVALQLELGMCIAVNRRPFGCPEITLLMWIEQLQWGLDDKGNATLTLQCSPVDPTPQAQFAAWRTTLAAAGTSGQPTITIHAPSFDSVNPLGAQLIPGMQLTLGTETLTIKSVSNTGSSWTTGTVTFTTNLAATHANGSSVTEPLPSGTTNPAAWDANAAFDSVVFTY